MRLFFPIQNSQLLRFCMDDEKFAAILDYVLLCFLFNKFCIVLLYYFIFYHITSFLHTRSLLVQYAYVSIESIDYILLSLLTSSVNTL